MGTVWRARHVALKRDDALKVPPDAVASEPDRLARFERECQVLASMNQPPGVGATTYDVSPDGRRFLMIKSASAGIANVAPFRFVIVENWVEELKRLVATN